MFEIAPQETKERIVDAALALFAQSGFNAVTVRAIAERANVNISAINYHFESKENLYRTIIRLHTETKTHWAMETLNVDLKSVDEFRIRFMTFAELLMKSVFEKPEVYQCMEREILQNLPYAREEFKNFLPVLVSTLERYLTVAQDKKWLRQEIDCKIVALSFFPLLFSHFRDKNIFKEFFDINVDEPEVQAIVVRNNSKSSLNMQNYISRQQKRCNTDFLRISNLLPMILASVFFPASFAWAHGSLLPVLIFFIFMSSLPSLPAALFMIRWLLRKYPNNLKGNIWFVILQLSILTYGFIGAFWLLDSQVMIMKAFAPILVLLWLAGYFTIFIRFAWLESQDKKVAVYTGIFGALAFPVFCIAFAFALSRLLS